LKEFIINNKRNLALGAFALLVISIWTYYSFHRFPTFKDGVTGYPVQKNGIYAVPPSKADIASKIVNDNNLESIVFFTTTTHNCPACKEVSDFIDANSYATKFKISKIDSYGDKIASEDEIITKIDDACNISVTHSGVPLIYDEKEKKCIYSVQAIKDYFNKKI